MRADSATAIIFVVKPNPYFSLRMFSRVPYIDLVLNFAEVTGESLS